MAGPTNLFTGRTTVGVLQDKTMQAATGTYLTYGFGYTCSWDAAQAMVTVTRLDGKLKESIVAQASSGKTPDTKGHIVSCARKNDGSWELIVDGKTLTPGINKKDLTYKALMYYSTLLTADSTFRTIDDFYVRDCN